MVCGESDYQFVGAYTMRNGKCVPAYECGLYRRKGKHACTRKSIERDKFEAFILSRVKDKIRPLLNPSSQIKIIKDILKDRSKNGNGNSIENKKAEIAKIDAQIDNLIDIQTASPKSKDRIIIKLEKLYAEKEQNEAEFKGLETKKTAKINVERVINKAVEHYRACFKQPFNRLDLLQRQEIIRRFIKQIKIYASGDAGITYYNIPLTDTTSPLFSACVEREKGIEPSQPAWKASVLPLNYSRELTCVSAHVKYLLCLTSAD